METHPIVVMSGDVRVSLSGERFSVSLAVKVSVCTTADTHTFMALSLTKSKAKQDDDDFPVFFARRKSGNFLSSERMR